MASVGSQTLFLLFMYITSKRKKYIRITWFYLPGPTGASNVIFKVIKGISEQSSFFFVHFTLDFSCMWYEAAFCYSGMVRGLPLVICLVKFKMESV